MLNPFGKRLGLLVVIIMAIAVLAGCGGKKEAAQPGGAQQQPETITLKLGHVGVADDTHSWQKFAKKYAEVVAQKTNGKVKIVVYPASQLGADREMNEALQLGNQEMGLSSTMTLGNFVPKLQVWDLPYIFPPDNAGVDKILDGAIGDELAQAAEEKGFKILSFWENDWRMMSNSKRPIQTVEDLKGLKMRIPETPALMDWLPRTGATPTPMAFSELYTALQQKTVDGQDNGVGLTFKSKFYEVQKYYSLTRHIYSPLAVIASKKVWDKLPADVQKVLADTAKELAPEQRAYNRDTSVQWLEDMKAKGMQINDISAENIKGFQDSAKPTFDKFRANLGDLIDKMLEAGK
ncbi:hypothetical protein SY88_20675 [Clostridiales bacterium PH28_bin88]|nr:hypothetical protein SY88_20675 [Clostridiales bacterium PH28_bin88]